MVPCAIVLVAAIVKVYCLASMYLQNLRTLAVYVQLQASVVLLTWLNDESIYWPPYANLEVFNRSVTMKNQDKPEKITYPSLIAE